ncbi:MAG: hypothetical protein RMY34_04360 [Aulosira sp. DedQUE10]|nr:hypothetical protein [Aulosira sp. DedQUE10]
MTGSFLHQAITTSRITWFSSAELKTSTRQTTQREGVVCQAPVSLLT